MNADFLDGFGGSKTKSKKAATIDVPFAAVPDISEKVEKATNAQSVKHGRYKQLTFRLPHDHLDEISHWAKTLGVSQEDMKRWLVARGLKALSSGERPLSETVTTKVIKLP
jgi:hypothetical protein